MYFIHSHIYTVAIISASLVYVGNLLEGARVKDEKGMIAGVKSLTWVSDGNKKEMIGTRVGGLK